MPNNQQDKDKKKIIAELKQSLKYYHKVLESTADNNTIGGMDNHDVFVNLYNSAIKELEALDPEYMAQQRAKQEKSRKREEKYWNTIIHPQKTIRAGKFMTDNELDKFLEKDPKSIEEKRIRGLLHGTRKKDADGLIDYGILYERHSNESTASGKLDPETGEAVYPTKEQVKQRKAKRIREGIENLLKHPKKTVRAGILLSNEEFKKLYGQNEK